MAESTTESASRATPATRAALTTAELVALAIAAAACLGFGALGVVSGSPSVSGYVGAVVVVAAGIWSLRRKALPGALAMALGIAVVVHLAGGLVDVGNDVLYNASVGPYSRSLDTHLLQYDHFAHAYASLVGTLTIWVLLASAVTQLGRRATLVLVALAGVGVGGLNEMVEFIATLTHRGAHVGGYANTGWDLVCNAIGVAIGIAIIAYAPAASRWRTQLPRPSTVALRRWALVASASATTLTAIVLAVARTGYSASNDTVSLLGAPGAPYATTFRVFVVVFGCSVVVAADIVGECCRRRPRATATLVAIYGAGTAFTGVVPKAPVEGPHSLENLAHVSAAVGAGMALSVAMLLVARWGRTAPLRRGSAAALTVTVLGALLFRLTWGTSVYGAVQRIILATAVGWLVALAITAGSHEQSRAPLVDPA